MTEPVDTAALRALAAAVSNPLGWWGSADDVPTDTRAARLIVPMSPATVRALCDEIDRLRAVAGRVQASTGGHRFGCEHCGWQAGGNLFLCLEDIVEFAIEHEQDNPGHRTFYPGGMDPRDWLERAAAATPVADDDSVIAGALHTVEEWRAAARDDPDVLGRYREISGYEPEGTP